MISKTIVARCASLEVVNVDLFHHAKPFARSAANHTSRLKWLYSWKRNKLLDGNK